jgi:CBS domain-containing protein
MSRQRRKRSKLKDISKVTETIEQFYTRPVESIMGKMIWDLPIMEKDEDILHALAIMSGSDHVWVVESKANKKLIGLITEPDILRTLAPTKRMSFFGTASKHAMHSELYETAEHIMEPHPLTCYSSGSQ